MHSLKQRLIKAFGQKKIESQNGTSVALEQINQAIKTIDEQARLMVKAVAHTEGNSGKNEPAELAVTMFPFLEMSMQDILITGTLYLKSTDEIERKFICRTAAHHMYEFLEDASAILGKQMGLIVNKLNDERIADLLKTVRKLFNEIKKVAHSNLKNIRHNVSGHKDRDIRKQFKISDEIDVEKFQYYFHLFMTFYLSLIVLKNAVYKHIKEMAAKQNNNP